MFIETPVAFEAQARLVQRRHLAHLAQLPDGTLEGAREDLGYRLPGGGRYMDRTCDFHRVKVALYR